MSVADRFVSIGSFPFCVQDISGFDSHASHVDNLTLADVMAFAWNFESFTINTDGVITDPVLPTKFADGTHYLTLSPIASDAYTIVGTGGDWGGDMWFGAPIADTSFGSFPAIRVPRARICYGASQGSILDLGVVDAPGGELEFQIGFNIGTDPVNAGKYRLYYRFDATATDALTQTIQIYWRSENVSPGVAFSAWNSGTISLAGISLNWYSFSNTGMTRSGTGAMTASGSYFTY